MKYGFRTLILFSITQFFPPVVSATDADLSVMTFNLRHAIADEKEADIQNGNQWEKRKSHVLEVINTKLPDILAVQEMTEAISENDDPIDYVRDILVGKEHENQEDKLYKNQKGIGGSPKDIFYKKDKFFLDTSNSGTDYIWPDRNSEICNNPEITYPELTDFEEAEGRSVTWATLTNSESGGQIFVVNTHLHTKPKNSTAPIGQDTTIRIGQLKCIRKIIEDKAEDRPVILMGDLNATHTSYEICSLEKGFKEKQKPLFEASGKVFEATYNGFLTDESKENRKLDYIFLRGMIVIDTPEVVKETYTDGDNTVRQVSDHFPVYAKLKYHQDSSYTDINNSPCNRGFLLFW